MHKTEILAPAGSWEAFTEAIKYGANAIYFGVDRLNARGDKAQFTKQDIPQLVHLAQEANVLLYLTMNILIEDSELEEAHELAAYAVEEGIDALIVQDRGLMQYLVQHVDNLVLHASTQCTAGTKEAILAYQKLGCSRVVLPRELNLEEIRDLSNYASRLGMETEVFIQGALCFSVSGQCHMSQFMGGRNANRGDCAQVCRKTYQILEDGALFRSKQAWISPKDISAFPILDELIKTGISSLKIEGRLRSAEYVGQTVAIYRNAVDALASKREFSEVLTSNRERDLLLTFNRGGAFQHAFFDANRNKSFLSEKETSHLGLFLGTLESSNPRTGFIAIRLDRTIDNFYLPRESSFIAIRDENMDLNATAPCVDFSIQNGLLMAKGFHPDVLRKLQASKSSFMVYQSKQSENDDQVLYRAKKKPITFHLYKTNRTISLRIFDEESSVIVTENMLDEAPVILDKLIDENRIAKQLGKLGNTEYEAKEILVDITLPWRISDLNALRRLGLEHFAREQNQFSKNDTKLFAREYSDLQADLDTHKTADFDLVLALPNWQGEALSVLFDAYTLLLLIPAQNYLRLEQTTIEAFHQSLSPRTKVILQLPPEKISDLNNLLFSRKDVLSRFVNGFSLGPSGLPQFLKENFLDEEFLRIAWQGSQIWNSLSVDALIREQYDYLLLSPELTRSQTVKLLKHLDSRQAKRSLFWAYGRTEAMFSRFCPIGFSQGKQGCRLCKEHHYDFVDQNGRVFPLSPQKDLDCSLQIWQSEALNNVESYLELAPYGIKPAISLVDEDDAIINNILKRLDIRSDL